MKSQIALGTLLASAAAIASPALTQNTSPTPPAASEAEEHDSDIIVTAPFVDNLELLAGTSVLTGAELTEDIRGQIGDTLTALPGVSATSFSPGASRPVLRGFQGERVRVLTDGIGALDVSNTSNDHAVSIDPLTAERIEVLRGPAVLLFGSQAIGGAVNIIDRRIPRKAPANGYHIDMTGALGSAANEYGGGIGVDLEIAPRIVFHADASYRNSDDLDVGGFVLAPPLRDEQFAIAAEELVEGHADEAAEALDLANSRGTLPNSATKTFTLGSGLAFVSDGGSLGASIGYYDTIYGIPARPGAGHHPEKGGAEEAKEEGEVPVSIDLNQIRADVRGEVKLGGSFLDSIRLRAGYADYEHTEFEGEEVGTVFDSQATEGRLEFVQTRQTGPAGSTWRGVIGGQGFVRDFSAVGAEAFLPPNHTGQLGFFTLQEFDFDKLGVELGLRYERTNVSSNAVKIGVEEDAPTIAVDRNFDAFSAAAGASYALTPSIRVGINGSRSERAPSAEELFANGPHIATQSYEIGNPGFTTEKSWGVELFARGDAGPVRFQVAGYANWFDDYIFETATGDEIDVLPVFQFRQAGASYYGVEAEVGADLFDAGGFKVSGDVVADYVRASIEDNGFGGDSPVPRIPPLRVLGGIEAQSDQFGGRVEAEYTARQNRVTDFENPTDDHTLVNASLTWRPWGRSRETALILSANNVFDVDARRHASFTKDFVPLAGRDIRLSARFSF